MDTQILDSIAKVLLSRHVSAVILAAGASSRFCSGDSKKKQFTDVCGIPAVVRSAAAFDACPLIDEITVVTQSDDIDEMTGLLRAHGIGKLRSVVAGGKSRQESAFCGLLNADNKSTHIVFHDAARCLVTPDMISKVVHAAFRFKAASAGTRLSDTVKVMNGEFSETQQPGREHMAAFTTPQAFDINLYRAAAYTAKASGFSGTDDCSLAEYAGFRCRLVDCGHENIKITYGCDIALAEAILASRRNNENK